MTFEFYIQIWHLSSGLNSAKLTRIYIEGQQDSFLISSESTHVSRRSETECMMAHIVMSADATRIACEYDESCTDRAYTCGHDCMNCCSLIVSAATALKSQNTASAHEMNADDQVVMTTLLIFLSIMMVVIKINLSSNGRVKLESNSNVRSCVARRTSSRDRSQIL